MPACASAFLYVSAYLPGSSDPCLGGFVFTPLVSCAESVDELLSAMGTLLQGRRFPQRTTQQGSLKFVVALILNVGGRMCGRRLKRLPWRAGYSLGADCAESHCVADERRSREAFGQRSLLTLAE